MGSASFQRKTVKIVAFSLAVALLFSAAKVLWSRGKNPLAEKLLTQVFLSPVRVHVENVRLASPFPTLEATVHDFAVQGTNPHAPSDVFFVRRGKVRINLLRLVGQKVKRIEYIYAENASVYLHVDKNRVKNFQLFRPYDPKRTKAPDLVHLPHLEVKRCKVVYQSDFAERTYELHLDSTVLELRSFRQSMDVYAHTDGLTRRLDFGRFSIFEDRKMTGDLRFWVDKPRKRLYFDDATVSVPGIAVRLYGDMSVGPDKDYNLAFDVIDGDLHGLFAFIPEKRPRRFDATGRLDACGSLDGRDNDRVNPHFELRFTARKAVVRNQYSGAVVEGIELSGSFSNGKENRVATTAFDVENVRGYLRGKPFSGFVHITRLNDPFVEAGLRGEIDLDGAARFLGTSLPVAVRGTAHVDVKIRGFAHDMADRTLRHKAEYEGNVRLADVYLPLRPLNFESLNGTLRLKERHLSVPMISGFVNGQPFKVSGFVPHFIEAATGYHPVPVADLVVSGPEFNLEEFLAALRRPLPADGPSPPHPLATLALPPADVNLIVSYGGFRYKNAAFDKFRAVLRLKDGKLTCSQLQIRRPGDTLNLNFEIQTGAWNHYRAQAHVTTADFDRLSRELGLAKEKENEEKKSPPGALSLSGHALLTGRVESRTPLKTPKKAVKPYGVRRPPPSPDSLPPPTADLRLKLYQFQIFRQNTKLQFDSLGLVSRFTSRHLHDFQNATVVLDSIRGYLAGYPLAGKVGFSGPDKKDVEAHLNTKIELAILLELLNVRWAREVSGMAEFGLNAAGRYDDLVDPLQFADNVRHVYGDFRLNDGALTFASNDLRIQNLNAVTAYDSTGIYIRDVIGQLESTRFEITGRLKDFLSYVLAHRPLIADILLRADTLRADEILARRDRPERKFALPELSDIRADARIDRIDFDGLIFDNVVVETSVVNRTANVHKANMDFADGKLGFVGRIYDGDSLDVFANLKLRSVNVRRALEMTDDFTSLHDSLATAAATNDSTKRALIRRAEKTTFLEAAELDGRLSGDATLLARISENLKADLKNIRLDIDFSIADGSFSHPELQRKLGFLIRKKFLQTVPFEFTGSNLRFENGYLTVPELALRTGIGTVTMEGRHYRTGRFRYRMTLTPERRRDRVLISGLMRVLAESPQKTLVAFVADGYKKKLKLRIDWLRIKDRTIGKLVRTRPPVFRSKKTIF
jgi:hypothetical protein